MTLHSVDITYNPSIVFFSIDSFYNLFVSRCPYFADGDQHVLNWF